MQRAAADRRAPVLPIPLLVVASLVLALSGCASPVAGRTSYTLVGAAGSPLPATVDEDVVASPEGIRTYRLEATEGSLELSADGTYLLRVVWMSYSDEVQVSRMPFTDRGVFREASGALWFGSNTIEDLVHTGSFGAEGLVVDFDLYVHSGEHETAALEFRPQ